MKSRRVALLVVVAIALGCGGPPSSKGSNSGSNENPNQNPNQNPNTDPNGDPNAATNSGPGDIEGRLWATVCDVAFNCSGVQPEVLAIAGRFSSEAECAAAADFPGLDLSSAQVEASIADGRASWNEAAAQQCFAALRETMCGGGGFADAPACDEVIVGLVPAGGDCATDEECGDGYDCVSMGEDCFGTCEPNCGAEQCTGEQICDVVEETCRLPGGVGDACSWDPDCESALLCDDSGLCSAGGTVPDGGDCGSTVECTDGLVCFQGTCGAIAVLTPGASCSIGENITAVCPAGTVCTNLQVDGNQLVGTCSTAQPQGGACRLVFECQWGLRCDAASPLEIGQCVPALQPGEACAADQECLSLNCEEVCVETGGGDEVCALP